MRSRRRNPLGGYSDNQISAFFLMFLAFGVLICLAAVFLFAFSVFIGIVFSGVGLFFLFMSYGYWKEAKRREQTNNSETSFADSISSDNASTTFTRIPAPRTSSLLDAFPDRLTSRVPNIGSCIQIYSYVKVPITNVDRDMLLIMHNADSWDCTLQMNGNDAQIYYNGQYVGILQQGKMVEMVSDWLRRGDPIRCEVTGTKTGKEHVVLAFYRDEEKRLAYREQFVTKLTAFSSERKQDSIQSLNDGEKLTLSEDPYKDNVINVLDYCEDSIGNLPVKFSKMHEECPFAGVFLDHVEYDDEKDEYVPYVKMYK